jgi:glutamate dehydrogenase/leucine dehydrogenase
LGLEGLSVAIQGFGAVGRHAARFFSEAGSKIVAVADITGAVYDPDGLDFDELAAHKDNGETISEFPDGRQIERDSIIGVDCDLLIPAARPDVIHADNQADVKAKLIVPGANIGITDEAEHTLYERGVLCIPDFIANAGGVICAAVEYSGGRKRDALAAIDEKVRANTAEMLERMDRDGSPPREAAVRMARERVDAAMHYTRFD